MMKYPIGIQTFADIRENNFVYVDKSAFVYDLAQQNKYYFLSRPRRFGKSLLISTLESYFLGKKELFKGLAIEKLETEWTKYPVFRIDLNTERYETLQDLNIILNDILSKWEAVYGSSPSEQSFSRRFSGIVQRACEQTGEKVVILVDEYDKPLLQTIDKPEVHEAYRNMLKAFYGVLKSQDQYIRFGFLTGVTKFSHVSVFSDLNNLNDISMDEKYVSLCGISEDELHVFFESSIRELATANNMTYEEACAKLREQYDGYHFCEDSVGIYNPFSLLNTFAKKKFRDYWFETGTPTFLLKLLERNHYELSDLQGVKVDVTGLNNVDNMYSDPTPVLYQSGYLTIKDYEPDMGIYTLAYPNGEVERGFTRALVPFYTSMTSKTTVSFLTGFISDVKTGKPEDFLLRLQTILSDNDYRIVGKMELYFQNVLYVIFKMLGFYIDVERATSNGRMDITIRTKDYIYILELKLDGTAEDALRQIKDKQYDRPFRADGRKIFLIGVNFSSQTRTIEKWIVE